MSNRVASRRRNHELYVQPLLKWVGGKRQLIPQISKESPESWKRLIEPFFGGGAVGFYFQTTPILINDLNSDLILFYETVRDTPEELIAALRRHKYLLSDAETGGSDYFYHVRGWDRDEHIWTNLSAIEKSARLLFLNKTCYNGLFRVNNAGEFNAPYGHYKNPEIVPEGKIRAVSKFLQKPGVDLISGDYKHALKDIRSGDFVYLDPPYDPVSDTSSFTGYTKGGFDRTDQRQLFEECVKINDRGGKFLLSNSSTPFIHDLYSEFEIVTVSANRSINSVANGRGPVFEVLVRNY